MCSSDLISLMCSDGLTNMLEDEEIKIILNSHTNIEEKAKELVKAANNRGGKDNISVILISPFELMDSIENGEME